MICIHHNDLDGRCSAAIVERFNYERPVTYIETDYKDAPPSNEIIEGQDVIIVDFSYRPAQMDEIIKYAKRVVWIDHHATAKDYPYQYLTGLRNFEDKKFSGCELTWMYYFPTDTMPLSVRLIGDYDKWSLIMPDSKLFYEGMKLEENAPNAYGWTELLDNSYSQRTNAIITNGRTATAYRDNYCAGLCKSFGYETDIDGHKAYACNMFMFGSGGFGERFNKYPLCIAYIHDGKQFTVSLYSEAVDVGSIAKNHGGGGHKGAAGFVCDRLPFL